MKLQWGSRKEETDTVFSMLAFSMDCSTKFQRGSRKDVFSSLVMVFLLKVNQ